MAKLFTNYFSTKILNHLINTKKKLIEKATNIRHNENVHAILSQYTCYGLAYKSTFFVFCTNVFQIHSVYLMIFY